MGSHGITDKVAIVGMSCTKFGEHWGMGTDDLVLQAARARSTRPASAGPTWTPIGSAPHSRG